MVRQIKIAKRSTKPNPREDRPPTEKKQTSIPKPRKSIRVLPRNMAQEKLIDHLENDNKFIVFAVGSAGTGKSLLCTLHALEGLTTGKYQKIIICRPAVGLDGTSLGFLPGSLNQKLQPWTMTIMDIVKEYFDIQQVEYMINNEIIEFMSLEHVRGRTLKNCCLIFDEAQNTSKDTMKTILTRLGDGSRILVTGDLKQVDRKFTNNGLQDFIYRLRETKSDMIGITEFNKFHVERHPVVSEVLGIYGEDE